MLLQQFNNPGGESTQKNYVIKTVGEGFAGMCGDEHCSQNQKSSTIDKEDGWESTTRYRVGTGGGWGRTMALGWDGLEARLEEALDSTEGDLRLRGKMRIIFRQHQQI